MLSSILSLKIRFGLLNSLGLGHIWANLTYFDFLYSPYPLLIIVDSSKICNINALSVLIESTSSFKVKYIVLPSLVARFTFRVLKYISSFLPLFHHENIFSAHHSPSSLPYGSPYRFYSSNQDFPFIYKKAYSSRSHYLNSFFDEFNINSDKYVLIFCRDSDFWGKSNLSDLRNSSFSNLKPSIDLLIKLGFSVIRVGRSDLPRKYTYHAPQFSDISWSRLDPSLFEDLLFAQSSFIISSNSGISQYQRLESNPMLLLNWVPFGLRPFFSNTRYMCKHIISSDVEFHPLTLPKTLLLSENVTSFSSHGYTLRENSSSLITDSVISMVNDIYSDSQSSFPPEASHPLPFVYGGSASLCPSYLSHLSRLDPGSAL